MYMMSEGIEEMIMYGKNIKVEFEEFRKNVLGQKGLPWSTTLLGVKMNIHSVLDTDFTKKATGIVKDTKNSNKAKFTFTFKPFKEYLESNNLMSESALTFADFVETDSESV